MSLEQEIDVVAEGDALAVWECEEMIIVEDAIKAFNPLRVDIPIAHNPRSYFTGFLDDLSSSIGEYPVAPLACVEVHLSKKLLSRH